MLPTYRETATPLTNKTNKLYFMKIPKLCILHILNKKGVFSCRIILNIHSVMNTADMMVHPAMTGAIITVDAAVTEMTVAKTTETTDTTSTGITDVKTVKTTDAIIAEITGAMSTETGTATMMICGGDNHILCSRMQSI